MFNLNRLFEDFFADPEFSVPEKLAFADDTRSRLAANNGSGAFNVVLAEVDAGLTAAGGATASEAVALAVRKGAVQAKRTLMETIKDTISRRAGRINDDFGKGSPEYLEFFPQGVTAYREMIEAEVEPKLEVLIAAGGNYDPAMQTEFKGLRDSWKAVRLAAGEKIGTASAADASQDTAMKALNLALLKAIFTAALTYAGQPEMGPILFDQSKLENKNQAPKPPTP